ncbi:MAG: MutS-related protein [Sediminibacterium sp.]
MKADNTTLIDLSIFHPDAEQSVFQRLNFTQTNEGREYLRMFLSKPLNSVSAIIDTQVTLQNLTSVLNKWPQQISNGTIMVLEKFYDTPIDRLPNHPGFFDTLLYQFISATDFSLTKYTVEHAIDFVKGMNVIVDLLEESKSKLLLSWRDRIRHLLRREEPVKLLVTDKKQCSAKEILELGNFLRQRYKNDLFELIDIYHKLDAYQSMAIAGNQLGLHFPEVIDAETPFLEAEGLFHLLLPVPIPYDIRLNQSENFIFLTGANMAGKSTFIKAVGIAAYLAHIGMGVPAKNMKIALLNGILSNIQVSDNLIRGESYFFNEVQRIKNTIETVNLGNKWLILIDELFKGTNQEDAIRCSTAVMEGLSKKRNSLFILSTHLYEIGVTLQQYSNVQFRFFETSVADGELQFSYQLKPGISNDRLGYLILQKEGVLDLLRQL